MPSSKDRLECCTEINETSTSQGRRDYIDDENEENDYNTEDDALNIESQVLQLTRYVNILSQEMSPFNSDTEELQKCKSLALSPSIISLTPVDFQADLLINNETEPNTHSNELLPHESMNQNNTVEDDHSSNTRSIITIISRALDGNDIQIQPSLNYNVENSLYFDSDTLTGIHSALCSLDHFTSQNNLDRKQSIAFQAICASFMMSFLNDPSLDHDENEIRDIQQRLKNKGAKEQLLICVTGPGGSGKSHVMKCCRMYCKLFCNSIGKPFNFSVFPVTATSNSAASLLQGITIHAAAMLNNKIVQMELSTDVDWTMTKVLIIDEISMADKKMFQKLDRNLRLLTGYTYCFFR